jgi:hypothetical protein
MEFLRCSLAMSAILAVSAIGCGAAEGDLGSKTSAIAAVESEKTAENFLLGDINGDGSVNIIDGLLVARFVRFGETNLTPAEMARRGDFNGDGSVTIHDANEISRFAAGLEGNLIGDVNGDSEISPVDALLVARFIQLGEATIPAATMALYGDFDEDGSVTLQDAIAISRYAAGFR